MGSAPPGLEKKRVDQVNKDGEHGGERAQKEISHTVVIGMIQHPLPSHWALRPVVLFSVPLSPQDRTEQPSGLFVKPLLFLLLQFPPY